MITFQVISTTRTTSTTAETGWAVERKAQGDMTQIVSVLFATEAEALAEAKRLAALEGKDARVIR
jgi:hypothetical protein